MIKLYIVTYKKNDVLNQNLRTLWATVRRPERIEITVISNHPEVVVDPDNLRSNLRVLVNATRAANSWGYLSRDWNFGIQDAFINWRNPNNVDWCVLAQNDVEWVDGWDEFLDKNDRFDFVSQPAGDQSMAINIAGVRQLGFFDERFCTLHFHEFDYFLRAMLAVGERASINDTQGAVAGASWNPIGCVLTEAASSGFDEGGDNTLHTARSWPEMRNLLFHKWNARDLAAVENKAAIVRARQTAKTPDPKEVNWYPFFWDGASLDEAPAMARFLSEYQDVVQEPQKRGWRSLLGGVGNLASPGGAAAATASEQPHIGIIIQGPLATNINGRKTADVLQALALSPLRNRFTVSLSVWADEPAPLTDLAPLVDQIVLCDKPERNGSCNRLYQAHAVTSALSALEQLTNVPTYVLKTRPDIVLSERFLQRLVDMADRGTWDKVLVTNLFTRYENFHISDMVVFSTLENIRMWFGTSEGVYYEDLFSPEVQFARTFVRNRRLPYSYRMEDYLRFLRDWIVLVDFADEGLIWFKSLTFTTKAHNRIYGLLHDRDVGPVLTRIMTVPFHTRLKKMRFGMKTLAAYLLTIDNLGRVLVNMPILRRRCHTYTVDRAGAEHDKPILTVNEEDSTPSGLAQQPPARIGFGSSARGTGETAFP